MSNPSTIRNYTADAGIAAYTLVKPGSVDANVAAAGASTDLLLGVTLDIAPATGERVDVVHGGITFVTAGAAISRGARLTSDASGRAIAAAPGAGVNAYTIGIALESASAAGDVVNILIAPGVMQG